MTFAPVCRRMEWALKPPRGAGVAYLDKMPVEKFLRGISRFQKDVYPQHQDLFEKLALVPAARGAVHHLRRFPH